MNKTAATDIKIEALRAIEALSSALDVALAGCDRDDHGRRHKQVGSMIGQIQMGILEPIVAQYPDLDNLQ